VKLASELEYAIRCGKLKPGDRLPTEHELMEKHGLSRITVRHALDMLTSQQLIERFPNRGSFVAQPSSRLEAWDFESIDHIIRWGAETETRLVGWRPVKAPGEVSRKLMLRDGEEVFRLRGLRHRDGEPMYYIEAHMLKELGSRIERQDLLHRTPIDLFANVLEVKVVRAVEEVWIEQADATLAKHLQLRAGDLVVAEQIDLFGQGLKPLQVLTGWWRTEAYRRRFETRR
jgi:GntR family transcriptional regulator